MGGGRVLLECVQAKFTFRVKLNKKWEIYIGKDDTYNEYDLNGRCDKGISPEEVTDIILGDEDVPEEKSLKSLRVKYYNFYKSIIK